MEGPIIKIQLEALREKVAAAMVARSEEFDSMIAAALEKELTAESLHFRVEEEVRKAVDEAIKSLSEHHTIRSIVTDIVAACLRDHENRMARIGIGEPIGEGPEEKASPYVVTFSNAAGDVVGRLDYGNREMKFEGNAEESARLLFDYLSELAEQERRESDAGPG